MTATPHIQRTIGQQLATAMSAYTWPGNIPTLSAVWRRKPDYELEDLGTLKVSIVPGPVQLNQRMQQPRGADWFELTVGIVVAKHVGTEQEIQDIEDLNQAIIDAIRSKLLDLEASEAANWIEIAQPVPYDPDVLANRNVFLSQIEVTYTVALNKLSAGS